MHPTLTPHLDVALLVFWAFVLFFICLVFYLRREDRREGYPLEDEFTGRLETAGGPLHTGSVKSFRLPFGQGVVTAPTGGYREPVDIAARRTDRFAGAPYAPTGNPLVDGVGPAAWADRAKRPDLDMEGHPRIVPISTAPGFSIARQDDDLIGWPVVAADDKVVGIVEDLWIDKADRLVRYLAVALNGGAGTVLAPMMDARVRRGPGWIDQIDGALRVTAAAVDDAATVRAPGLDALSFRRSRRVEIDAITSAQFADAPRIGSAGTVTLYEEDRIQAYFGGGYLYATPARSEPLL